MVLECLYLRATHLLCDTSIGYLTTTERALNSGDYIALRFDTRRDNALTCYELRFVELTVSDQPDAYMGFTKPT